MKARSTRIAEAQRDAIRAAPGLPLRFEPAVPEGSVDPYAADATPRVFCTPLGESVERQRKRLLRTIETTLLFAAPLSGKRPRGYWLAEVERTLALLEHEPMAGFAFDGYEVTALWDPEAARASRFAAAYTMRYLVAEIGKRHA